MNALCDCPIRVGKWNRPLEDRFWEKVEKSSGCWLWVGSRQGYGHGCFLLHHGHSTQSHRVAWMLSNKRMIPDGGHILHKCDNPPCVNPDHLYLGDHAQNMRDKAERGRAHSTAGEKNGMAVLTADDVARVRSLYHGRYGDVARISRTLNLPYHAVWGAARNVTWVNAV